VTQQYDLLTNHLLVKPSSPLKTKKIKKRSEGKTEKAYDAKLNTGQ
jgi:hypothetical protein